MIILRKKRIMFVLLTVFASVFTYLLIESLAIKNKNITVQTVALPVSNKVIIIDAGHRTTRWWSSRK